MAYGYKRVSVGSGGFGGYDFDSPNVVGSVSKNQESAFGREGMQPILADDSIYSTFGSEGFGAVPGFNREVKQGMARGAIDAKGEKERSEMISEANRARAKDLARARTTGNIISTVGKVASAFLPVPKIG